MKDVNVCFQNVVRCGKPAIREFISQFEELVKKEEAQHGVVPPIEHYFSKGIYAREMKMKAGELVVGKIHRFEQLNILSEGEVSVLSIDGLKRVKAPHTFVGSAGAKRLIYAHTDVTWTVIHGTVERDLGRIEDEFIAQDYEDLKMLEGEV